MIGKVPPASQVSYAGRDLRVTTYGTVVFGVARDEQGPLEIAVRRGPVSKLMVSYPSTVTHTLPLVLADTGIELAVADVPSAWLNSGVPVGAGDFLESVTSSARRRHGLQ